MSNQFQQITGLVVRSTKQGDYNRILKIATANGDIDAICYNCQRPKSPLLFLNEPFTYAEFELKKSKGDLPQIHSANLIRNFYNLRFSLDKVETATEICRIVEKTIHPNVEYPLPLILNTLHILDEAPLSSALCPPPSLFTLRLLTELGFPLDIELANSFLASHYSLLDFVQSAPLSKLYNLPITDQILKRLTALAKISLEQTLHLK